MIRRSHREPVHVRGFATGGLPKPTDVVFWTHTNGCDKGCVPEVLATPSTEYLTPMTTPDGVAAVPWFFTVLVNTPLA